MFSNFQEKCFSSLHYHPRLSIVGRAVALCFNRWVLLYLYFDILQLIVAGKTLAITLAMEYGGAVSYNQQQPRTGNTQFAN